MSTQCLKVLEKMKKGFQKLENCDDDKSENGDKVLPIEMDYLTPALIEEARKKLNETDETKQKALAEFRKLIAAEKNLETPTDDLFLLAFLRSRKFNVKKAFHLFQSYWTCRKENTRLYDFIEEETMKSILIQSDYFGLMRFRDRNGCVVFVFKVALWDPERNSVDDLFRAITGVLVYTLSHEATQIAGFRAIMDLRGLTWNHIKHMTPPNILFMIRSTQFCFPARYKGIHILSENKTLNIIWSMIYPFLTSKLKRRIFFHGEDVKPLSQFVHPSVLPEEFGGQAATFNNEEWKESIYRNADAIMSHIKYGYKD